MENGGVFVKEKSQQMVQMRLPVERNREVEKVLAFDDDPVQVRHHRKKTRPT